MNTETKKRKLSPAQQLKAELKKEYPGLIVSCTYDTYSMGCSINVDIKNLHYTPYPLEEVQLFCYRYQNVRTYEGEILNGGNRYVHINNLIDNEIQKELDQMFISYLSIYKGYENLKEINYDILIELPSKHRETYQNLLANQSYYELLEPQIITIQETTQETTTDKIMNETKTELELNNSIEKEIEELTDKLTARNDLLGYLEKNNINGKIQQATEEEINEIQQQLTELISLNRVNEINNKIQENENYIDAITAKFHILTLDEKLTAIEELNILKTEIEQLQNELNPNKPPSLDNDYYENNDINDCDFIPNNELVLTAPPTVSPQNVIELFPRKKTLDQLRKELITPEQYQDLIENFDTYTQEYQNLDLHGLQFIKDDYSAKDINGEFSPSYDQWHHFMQSHQDLSNAIIKANNTKSLS